MNHYFFDTIFLLRFLLLAARESPLTVCSTFGECAEVAEIRTIKTIFIVVFICVTLTLCKGRQICFDVLSRHLFLQFFFLLSRIRLSYFHTLRSPETTFKT